MPMMLFGRKKVESFSEIALSITYMGGREELKAICKGACTEVTFRNVYPEPNEPPEPLSETTCDTGTIIELLNGCGIMKWDGFHGKQPRYMVDGEMFTFEATVNDGDKIHASGSNNFPKGFWELRNGLRKIADGNG